MKLSDYVVKFFEKQKLEKMFMVTGGGCMHLVNSFGNSKKIEYVCMHHEQSAAMAAEAYAKMKTNLGLVLVTSGPGATNAITGLLGAYQDSIPCVFISGQAKRQQTVHNARVEGLRQFGVQEVDIIPIVQSISKFSVMISNPQKIRYYLEKAVAIAKAGRPGPVWLDIPLDVQSAIINETDLEGFDKEQLTTAFSQSYINSQVEFVAQKLATAKRPVIIAGHGIRLSGGIEALHDLCAKHKIPAVTPIMGIDLFAAEDQYNIGRVGTKGTRAGNFAMQNADVILSVGSRLSVSVVGHEYEKFATKAYKIVVDIDEIEHKKKTISIDKLIISDAKEFLDLLLSKLKEQKIGKFSQWLDLCGNWKAKYPVCLPEYDDDSKGINFYKFIDELSKYLPAPVPVVSDAGSTFYVTAQALQLKKGQRYITSGAIATMGFTLPAAIGVSCSMKPACTVAAITGDGSFQQNIQELQVMKHHQLPVKLFVMNNQGYFSIHQTQKRFFNENYVGESSASGISFPSTQKIAEAYEIEYVKINTISELNGKMEQILASNAPMIVEVMLTTEQEIIPTNSSKLREDGAMVSAPLEDMYPFLSREEFEENMICQKSQGE